MKNPRYSSKRSERSRCTEQKVKRAIRLLTGVGWSKEQARKSADYMKKCSCFMCENPRRTQGATRAEKRSNLSLDDDY